LQCNGRGLRPLTPRAEGEPYHPAAVCAQTAPSAPGRPRITPIQWVGLAVLVLLLLNQFGLLRFDSPESIPAELLGRLPFLVALLLAIPIHEFSHGLVATAFGDDTPRRAGRLTLNPLKHLDPLGTILILIGPIGWGRPMPINPAAMRNPGLGWALSSLAGPVSNVVAASIGTIVFAAIQGDLASAVNRYLLTFIQINVALAVFNLLPLPPLDGFGFVFGLVPTPVKAALLPLRQWGPLILLVLIIVPTFRPFLDTFLGTGQALIFGFLGELARAI
jgi:Zn-dependent protease